MPPGQAVTGISVDVPPSRCCCRTLSVVFVVSLLVLGPVVASACSLAAFAGYLGQRWPPRRLTSEERFVRIEELRSKDTDQSAGRHKPVEQRRRSVQRGPRPQLTDKQPHRRRSGKEDPRSCEILRCRRCAKTLAARLRLRIQPRPTVTRAAGSSSSRVSELPSARGVWSG